MSIEFEKKPLKWGNEGTEPLEEEKNTGYVAEDVLPAPYLNYQWHTTGECIEELQEKLIEHDNNKENPHNVTAEQIGLGNVNNTPDSQKNVAFASETAVARKVEYPLSVRFKGGDTEGTDLWTYDGSTSRSINITPSKIGAADNDHTHTLDDVTETEEKKYNRVVNATSTDGKTYTATIEGVTEFYNGMEITIIPNMTSTSNALKLNINGLGDVDVRQPLSFTTFVATAPTRDGFLYGNTPCRLMYHANYVNGGIWLMADKQKTSAQDLYGSVPVANGGTGASTAEQALENLGILLDIKTYQNNRFYTKEWGNAYFEVWSKFETSLYGNAYEDRYISEYMINTAQLLSTEDNRRNVIDCVEVSILSGQSYNDEWQIRYELINNDTGIMILIYTPESIVKDITLSIQIKGHIEFYASGEI